MPAPRMFREFTEARTSGPLPLPLGNIGPIPVLPCPGGGFHARFSAGPGPGGALCTLLDVGLEEEEVGQGGRNGGDAGPRLDKLVLMACSFPVDPLLYARTTVPRFKFDEVFMLACSHAAISPSARGRRIARLAP